ncbi:glycosyltransferase family 2 protein [Candidatus Woesearchaeota archaeon]|nr:glycosyltransferase family 2 protein [Candidatus Woesearchaeota archaeon]
MVDDYSTDGTRILLQKLTKQKKYKIYFHPENKGKGAAVRTGMRHVAGDIILVQDADLEYNPEDYSSLLEPIVKGKADVVYGSRFITMRLILFGKNRTIMPLHYIGNKMLTLLTSLIYMRKITDMETGYKVMKLDVVRKLKLRGQRFDFEPEITAKIIKKGYKIHEVPISFNPRSFKEGKKITIMDGIKAFYYLLKYRFMD